MSSRRFVALPESLLIEAVRIAERLGIPYTVLIERVLSEVLGLLRYKKNLLELLAMMDAFDDIRRLGGMFLPEKSIVELLKNLSTEKLSEVCSELTKMATWYAELSKVKRALTLSEVKNSLELWMPNARVDLVKEGKDSHKFVISFTNPSRESLEIFKCIVEGLARGYGLERREVSVGPSFLVLRVGGLSEE